MVPDEPVPPTVPSPLLERAALPGAARWLRSSRVFAGLLLALGLTCLVWSQWPLLPTNPGALDLVLGLTLTGLAAALLVTAPTLTPRHFLALLLLPLATVGILTATRVTEAGVALLATAWTLLAVTAALYLTRSQLIAFLAVQTVTYATATVSNPLPDLALVVIVTGVAALLVAAVVFILIDGQRHLVAELGHLAIRDPLTGLLNRRGAELEADTVRAVAERAHAPTTITVIDLDDFKAVNDRGGHQAGDATLRTLSRQWTSRLRTGDVLARIGGDEFLLVMPETDPDAAHTLLQRLRHDNPVGWSNGTVAWSPAETLDQALARADARLYRAKARRHPA